MSLLQVSEQNRLRCIDQLYDQWHGFYRVIERDQSGPHLGRALSKAEAQQHKGDVEIVWEGALSWAAQ